MKTRDKTQAHLRDDTPNPGVGLFVDERAKASAERAYARAVSLLDEGSFTEEDDDWMRKHLLGAARHYWADFDYDGRASAVELRAEIATLRQALGKVAKVTDKLSANARAALRAEMRKGDAGHRRRSRRTFTAPDHDHAGCLRANRVCPRHEGASGAR